MTAAPLHPEMGHAPPLTCSRVGCKSDATLHVIHNEDMVNGLACALHFAEFASMGWTYWRVHPYRLDCSSSHAVFVVDLNECRIVPEKLIEMMAVVVGAVRKDRTDQPAPPPGVAS